VKAESDGGGADATETTEVKIGEDDTKKRNRGMTMIETEGRVEIIPGPEVLAIVWIEALAVITITRTPQAAVVAIEVGKRVRNVDETMARVEDLKTRRRGRADAANGKDLARRKIQTMMRHHHMNPTTEMAIRNERRVRVLKRTEPRLLTGRKVRVLCYLGLYSYA
jgi:hypothetical protein